MMNHLDANAAPPRGSSLSCCRAAALALAALLAGFAAAGSALAADKAGARLSSGRALAERHGCLGCHAVQERLAGPAYQEVAQRYREAPGAAAELAQRIRSGGDGRWGAMPMPPQAQVSQADAKRLAAWILAGAK
jgi:cytochrome c551/c552